MGRSAQGLAEVLIAGAVVTVVLCLLMSALVTSVRAIARRAPSTTVTESALLARARLARAAGQSGFDDSRNTDASVRRRLGKFVDVYRNAARPPAPP